MPAIPASPVRVWSWTATLNDDETISVVGTARYDAQDGSHYAPTESFGYEEGTTVVADEVAGWLDGVQADAEDTANPKYYSFA